MKPLQALLALFACSFLPLYAASLADLTYTTTDGKVTITDCDEVATGELVIPDAIDGNLVTSIGPQAFKDCNSLTSIKIPSSVTSIGSDAFTYCTSLTSITIPDGVTSIGDAAFAFCESLTTIEVGAENVNYTDVNGVLFNKEKTLLHTYPAGKTGANYVVPDSVTNIGDAAFAFCESLTSISIPDGVTSIGAVAFFDCTSLTSITIPDGVTSIGDGAFYKCTSLTSITIPDSVTSIGDRAFSDCGSLTIITFLGVAPTVDTNAFLNMPDGAVALVTIEALSSFGESGDNWNGLTVDTILNPILTWTTTNGKVTITDCDEVATGELVIPDAIDGNLVTSIGPQAFKDCNNLTSIKIPSSVTSIGSEAFTYCTSLTSITIPDGVTSIEEEAFHYCSSLTSITIPDSVNSIGDAAFAFCESLTTIEVGVENVNYANVSGVLFNKDKTLLHTYPAGKAGANYVIPDSVTSIGNNAFRDCISLTSITIPDSVNSIGQYAFRRCSRMTNITIGNGVTSIGDAAFAFCESLTSISIPDGVTSIGNSAFRICEQLTSITIGNGVTSIGNGAFAFCESLTTIEVGAENVNYTDVNGVLFNKEKTLLHTYPAGKTGANYVVPDSVTNIGGGAFFEGTSLTSITIPDGVTSIGDGAFSRCTSLTSITIPDGVTSIGDRAFYKCTSLTSITIPDSVTSIGSDAFKDSTATITVKKDTQIAQLEAQLAQMTAERDARPTQAAYDVVVAERDAILSDIQLAYDEVTAAAGGAEADLVVEIVDPANAPLDTRNGGVVAQALEAFEVNTFASPANLDTEMALYDSAGTLITTNDDAPSAARPEGAGDLLSQLNFPDGLAGGVYYLAVGTYDSIFNSDFAVSSNGQGGEYTLTLPSGPFSGALEASGIDWYRIEIGTNFAALQLQPLTELYRNLVEANASAISERDARPTQTAYDTAVAESRTAGRSDVTSTPASYNLTTTESYNAVVTQRDARFVDTDKDGITDVKEAELETDSAEETVFYLQGAYDSAVAASRLAGRGDVTADPPTFALTTLAAYNGMIVQKDITITTLTTTVGEKNALIVQKDNQYNALEEQRVAEAQQLNGIIETRNNTISSNTATIGSLNENIAQKDTAYATVVAERDARPTQEQCDTNATEARLAGRNDVTTSPAAYQLISISTYNTAVAERDARPTQAAYDTVVTERDARPTQTSYNTVVAERNARPTEEAYNALIAERDARPTIEEVKDARLGSVVLQSDVANQSVKIRFSVEETDDFRTWTKRDEINEITVPLEVGKRFYRFALEDE